MQFGAPSAIITGASSGLGAAFARALAARGHDLILVARRGDRLAALAEALQTQHGIRAEAWPADLADPIALEEIAQRITALPSLDLLINNAGLGEADPFVEADPAHHATMVALHVAAPVRLTRAALPAMLAQRARRHHQRLIAGRVHRVARQRHLLRHQSGAHQLQPRPRPRDTSPRCARPGAVPRLHAYRASRRARHRPLRPATHPPLLVVRPGRRGRRVVGRAGPRAHPLRPRRAVPPDLSTGADRGHSPGPDPGSAARTLTSGETTG